MLSQFAFEAQHAPVQLDIRVIESLSVWLSELSMNQFLDFLEDCIHEWNVSFQHVSSTSPPGNGRKFTGKLPTPYWFTFSDFCYISSSECMQENETGIHVEIWVLQAADRPIRDNLQKKEVTVFKFLIKAPLPSVQLLKILTTLSFYLH